MKFFKFSAVLLTLMLGTTAYADIGSGAYIMYEGKNTAYFYSSTDVKSTTLEYDNTDGCPYIDIDGKAYISLKGFFGAFGDGGEYKASGSSITITVNSKKCTIPVEKKFIVRGNEDRGYMYVYKVYDDYYIPADIIALMFGGSVSCDNGNIVLITDPSIYDTVLINGVVKTEFFNKLSSNGFMNSINGTSSYLASDGKGIVTTDAESVVRVGNDVYFTKEYKLYRRSDKETVEISFTGEHISAENIYVWGIVNVGDKIFGLSTGNAFGRSGRPFVSNLDGSGFRYLNNSMVKNLICHNSCIYYMTDTNVPVMYVYNTVNNEQYELIIVDDKNNSLLRGANMFAITDEGCYLADDAQLRFIPFELPAYECEWIKLWDMSKLKVISKSAGRDFSKITAQNYDKATNTLWVLDRDGASTRLVKVNCTSKATSVAARWDKPAEDVELFGTSEGLKVQVIFADGTAEFIK